MQGKGVTKFRIKYLERRLNSHSLHTQAPPCGKFPISASRDRKHHGQIERRDATPPLSDSTGPPGSDGCGDGSCDDARGPGMAVRKRQEDDGLQVPQTKRFAAPTGL
ncbi:hypothetical protein RRG08_019739 [Elysia crispata]|uniref:Uncharacterized protein n=1 Tax=Elysia crispata TaxID=231223 RepID=A0AAE1CU72_9GAST|nr:hypothetical protein RRG08_019739 [Elysia crispata]